MLPTWLADYCFLMMAALIGVVAGWWLRGRPTPMVRPTGQPPANRKQTAELALQSLHAAADTVRSCVQQHTDCIRQIQAELHETSSTEPAIITNAADTIVAANGLVQHQFDDIEQVLSTKQEEIRACLAHSEGLLFTFAALDRQKHAYSKVLTSLELLAADLTSDLTGHRSKLQRISDGLEGDGPAAIDRVTKAVTQILDATEELQQRVESTEKSIHEQADSVHMQAILSHTDLLTALPNRRAFEAELEKEAAGADGHQPVVTVLLVDLDRFDRVNIQYGHPGGDVILRQAAAQLKQLMRGQDLVARYSGDTFAIVMHHTTLHDALPMAERVRCELENASFTHGNRPLRVTASVGVAQLRQEESLDTFLHRAIDALRAGQQAGGNMCFWHDGAACNPISSAFQANGMHGESPAKSLATLWRQPSLNEPIDEEAAAIKERHHLEADDGAALSGRSLFVANLSRRLNEWKRGGAAVSIVMLSVDQVEELTDRFGPPARDFLRQVLSRLLEAVTRDMDERCEFVDGVFTILLPGTDEASAVVISERLRSQVRQCKVRMGSDLWDITASIGLAHCTVASRVMDLMLSAEAAMKKVMDLGGDGIRIGEAVPDELLHKVGG